MGEGIEGFETIVVESVPPPTLPAPGAAQPPDPAAARLEVEQAFTDLHADIANWDTLLRLVDDPSGLDVLLQEAPAHVRQRILGIDVVITDLVFFSPIEASFLYRAKIGGEEMSPTYGRARLIDGTWRITRTTVCQDVRFAGNGLECTI
jgi:hypothetical protein